MNKRVCAFDFDGTLIKKDSIKLFCKWVCVSKMEYFITYHVYFRLLQLLGEKNLKFRRVNYFHALWIKRNLNIRDFTQLLLNEEFLDSPSLIRNMKKEHHVVIVSASFDFMLEGYAEYYGIRCHANSLNSITDLNFRNKVHVIKLNYGSDYPLEVAYGNSQGDFDMLLLADLAYYRTNKGKIIKWQK